MAQQQRPKKAAATAPVYEVTEVTETVELGPEADPVVTEPDEPDAETDAEDQDEADGPADTVGFARTKTGQEYCPLCKPGGVDETATSFTCEHGSWSA